MLLSNYGMCAMNGQGQDRTILLPTYTVYITRVSDPGILVKLTIVLTRILF